MSVDTAKVVKTRNLRDEDSKVVAKLIHQLTKNVVDPESLENRLKFMALHAGEGYDCLVLDVDGEVAGFGELAWYMIPSKGLMVWIEEVIIDKDYRGKGYSRILLDSLISVAERSNPAQIKLTVSNTIAKNIYKAFGFEDKGESLFIKRYY